MCCHFLLQGIFLTQGVSPYLLYLLPCQLDALPLVPSAEAPNKTGGSDGEEPAGSAGDPSSIPGSGRSPADGNGYPLQDSCLENSMDRDNGPWAFKESDMTERLTHTNTRGVQTGAKMPAGTQTFLTDLILCHLYEVLSSSIGSKGGHPHIDFQTAQSRRKRVQMGCFPFRSSW